MVFRRSVAAFGLATMASVASARPCDIYAAGGTPCVAAHSTTRKLYDNFSKALYQVQRSSDGSTKDIHPLSGSGVANADSQDSFCQGTTCVIKVIYDQSDKGNHLTRAPPGSAGSGPEDGGYDYLASAIGAPVYLGNQKAYGVFIPPSTGYRCNDVRGTAVDDQPQGMYAVLDGTHYNGHCCFDYGNAETNSRDNGNGHMETIYFGGSGPTIKADLENGLFEGQARGNNPSNPAQNSRFVTAVVKGKPHHWAIRGGNSNSSELSTYFDGGRPSGGYDPMQKEGAIILGIGGDNSIRGQGTFYEGIMTYGYPSDSTENKVQADIANTKYSPAPLNYDGGLSTGSSISLRATTSCCTGSYLTRVDNNVKLAGVSGSSSADLKQRASFIVRTGLGNSNCFSFEAKYKAGYFVRHSNNELKVDKVGKNDDKKLFNEDATFCTQPGLSGKDTTIRSWSYPIRFWRHFNGKAYIASDGGPFGFDAKYSFNDDVTFEVGGSWA